MDLKTNKINRNIAGKNLFFVKSKTKILSHCCLSSSLTILACIVKSIFFFDLQLFTILLLLCLQNKQKNKKTQKKKQKHSSSLNGSQFKLNESQNTVPRFCSASRLVMIGHYEKATPVIWRLCFLFFIFPYITSGITFSQWRLKWYLI